MHSNQSFADISASAARLVPYACLLRVQSVYAGLKSAERRAVDHLLQYPERIGGLTIVEFAGEAGCSEATIVRLSKRLGYEGFPELKRDFARVRENPDIPIAEDDSLPYGQIEKTDEAFAVFDKVVRATISALNDTVKIMSPEEYKRAVDLMMEAGRLLFVGLGDAGIVALGAQQRFLRVGKRSDAALDPDTQLLLASQLEPRDLLVAISHSGRSRTVLDVVKQAQNAGARVVAITNTPISPLAKRADVVLLTAVFTRYMTIEVISKRVTELCVIESLLMNYMNRGRSEAMAYLHKSEKAVEANKI